MAKIFISYNRQSEAIARTLTEDLEALGHAPWFDQELKGGQAWWDQILATVRDSDVFIFLLDTKSLDSTACKREYSYAAELGKPILPALVAEGVSTNLLPPALSQIQFVDYRQQDRDAIRRLARSLANLPPAKPLPDPLPPPPEIPLSYLGHLAQQIDTSNLDYAGQSALVLDLKKGFNDPETAEDTLELLKKLRKRRDLYATIAEEIDELVANNRKVPAETPNIQEPTIKSEPRHSEQIPEHDTEKSSATYSHSKPPVVQRIQPLADNTQPASIDANPIITIRKHWIGALVGAVLGAVIVLIASDAVFLREQRLLCLLIAATGGGFAGSISMASRERWIGMLGGAILVISIVVTTELVRYGILDFLGPYLFISSAVGAIAGSISGFRRSAIVGALLGAGLGLFFPTDVGLLAGGIFYGPILGAMAGRLFFKPKS